MVRIIRTAILLLGICLLADAHLLAQITTGSITGLVTDNTGAIMPGVTVSLTGQRVMGKQVQVTDSRGNYRFDRLPPGSYDLKFEMDGFNALNRQGIVVSATFTATVNVQLQVGNIAETVTVAGSAPAVDTRSNVQQTVMSQDILEGIPTGRDPWSVAKLIPGLTVSRYDVGGTQGMSAATMTAHGSNGFNQTIAIDGLSMNYPGGTGGATMLYYDQGMFEEVNFQTSAIPAEVGVGGVFLNMVTKSGSNVFHGDARYSFANESMQAENFADVTAKYNFPGGNPITGQYDFNATAGGPIIKDKMWFFGSGRVWRVDKTLLTTYNPDGSNAIDDNLIWNLSGKINGQLNPSHSVAVGYNFNAKNRYHRRDTPPNYVEDKAAALQDQKGYSAQVRYTGVLGARSVFVSTVGIMAGTFPKRYQKDVTPTDIRREDSALSTATGAAVANYENPNYSLRFDNTLSHTLVGAGGTHSFKAGVAFVRQSYRERARMNEDMVLIYNNGVAVQVRAYATPVDGNNYIQQVGIFGQDSWTLGHLTLNLGGRADRAHGWMPEQVSGAGRWVAERRLARKDVYKQWIAVWRLGLAYDVFKNGRTAIKGNVSRYGDQVGISSVTDVNPFAGDPLSPALSRGLIAWKDLNGNNLPEPTELGVFEGFTGGSTTRYTNPDGPNWGYSDEMTAGVEHELITGLRVGAMYYHRTNRNQLGSVNAAVPSTAYTPVTITNPLGGTITLYNLAPAYLGLQNNVVQNLSILDTDYDGFEITANKRFSKRWQVLLGFTVGRNKGGLKNGADFHDPNNLQNQQGIVGNDSTYQSRLAGTYVVPRAEVTVSGSFLSNTGYPRQTTYSVTRSVFPGLTRSSQTVYLTRRGDERLPSVRLLDLRFSRSFRLRTRVTFEPLFDIFNLTNSDAIVGVTNAVGQRLGFPSEIMSPRVFHVGFNVKF